MNLNEIKKRIEEIKLMTTDDESVHIKEDELMKDFILYALQSNLSDPALSEMTREDIVFAVRILKKILTFNIFVSKILKELKLKKF